MIWINLKEFALVNMIFNWEVLRQQMICSGEEQKRGELSTLRYGEMREAPLICQLELIFSLSFLLIHAIFGLGAF